MRLLVTGAGRCGTTWIAHCLARAGLPVTKERWFNDTEHGTGPWVMECSWEAAPYTPISDCYTIHLVREPLATIRSRWAWGTYSTGGDRVREKKGEWAMKVCPEIRTWPTPLERSAQHYVSWNRLVKGAAERIRLEDVRMGDVLRWARMFVSDAHLESLPPRALPSLATEPVEWRQVEHIPGLLEIAREYGYV